MAGADARGTAQPARSSFGLSCWQSRGSASLASRFEQCVEDQVPSIPGSLLFFVNVVAMARQSVI